MSHHFHSLFCTLLHVSQFMKAVGQCGSLRERNTLHECLRSSGTPENKQRLGVKLQRVFFSEWWENALLFKERHCSPLCHSYFTYHSIPYHSNTIAMCIRHNISRVTFNTVSPNVRLFTRIVSVVKRTFQRFLLIIQKVVGSTELWSSVSVYVVDSNMVLWTNT